MLLWFHWWSVVSQLRPACSRRRTFFWLVLVLAALCTRGDLAGVTSFVRALGLRGRCYGCLLDFFHSAALCPDRLARVWTRLVLKVHPGVERSNGRLVVLADGLKKGKCGRKMPAVKLLHQSGESNTKPAFIMGHSCQALALLARVGRLHHAVPLCARIHEGLVFSNRDQRTLLDKLLLLLASLDLPEPVLLIADAYYASGKIIRGLFERGGHLISRCKSNACAFEPVATDPVRRRGRPRLYGRKQRLRDLFNTALQTMQSPAYGEKGVSVRWTSRDLLWRPACCLVRFVAAGADGHVLQPAVDGRHQLVAFAAGRVSQRLPPAAALSSCPPTCRSARPRSSASTPCASKSRSPSSRLSTPSALGPTISG